MNLNPWRSGQEWLAQNPGVLVFLLLITAVILPFLLESPLDTGKEVVQAWGMPVGGDVRDAYKACEAAFEEKHPGIDVTMFVHGRAEGSKLLSGLAGGAPPDIVQLERYAIGDWVSRGAFLPLDSFLEREDDGPYAIQRSDYFASAWEQCTFDGGVYAVPSWTNAFAMAYNRKLFREAGLPDRVPRTWEEAFEFSKKLTKFDSRGNLIQGGWIPARREDVFSAFDVLHTVWSTGYDFFPGDARTAGLTADPVREACQLFSRFYELYGGFDNVMKQMQAQQLREYDDFITGQHAMVIDEDWIVYRTASFAPDFELGLGPIPGPDEGTTTSYSSGLAYLIPQGAKNPEGAWEFIKYMNSPEAALTRNRAWLRFLRETYKDESRILYPGFHSNKQVNQAVMADPDFRLPNPEHQRAFEYFHGILDETRGIKPTPAGSMFFDNLKRATQRYLKKDMTFDDAFGAAEVAVNKALDHHYTERTEPVLTGRTIAVISASTVLVLTLIFAAIVAWKSRGTRLRFADNWAGYLLASPWLFGFIFFTAGPIVTSILLSFCDYDILSESRFIGLANYREALLGIDPLFYRSMGNTAFMILAVPLNMAVALGIALLLNLDVRGMRLYRTLYYIPAIVPLAASAVLWLWLFQPTTGPLTVLYDATIGRLTETAAPTWLGDTWIKPSFILMGLWGSGAGMIIWLAGLKNIPDTLYEASSIDGAGILGRFQFITIPMLTPYIFFNLITGVIGTFQMFVRAMVITRELPSDAILFYVYHLFNNAFRYFRMGYASAMAWILFVIVLILTIIQVRGAKHWVHYGGD